MARKSTSKCDVRSGGGGGGGGGVVYENTRPYAEVRLWPATWTDKSDRECRCSGETISISGSGVVLLQCWRWRVSRRSGESRSSPEGLDKRLVEVVVTARLRAWQGGPGARPERLLAERGEASVNARCHNDSSGDARSRSGGHAIRNVLSVGEVEERAVRECTV
jgi:hypothetical protein